MPKIVHFEINADDVSRAKNFYEKVFKWKIQSWEGNPTYHLIEAGEEGEPGINGGLQKREEPADQIFNYISVSSVDDTKKLIEENGGTIESPRVSVPGVGHFYMFKDPEGNKLGIMEEDENAQ
ncbi:MAG: VOC family protein [Candidatus Thorarchaeota archaeon]